MDHVEIQGKRNLSREQKEKRLGGGKMFGIFEKSKKASVAGI
jgi:hypothetical protein